MKSIFLVIATLTLAHMPLDAQAGFLDKLADRVQESVKDTVINKAANKAGEKTEDAIDSAIDPKNHNDQQANQGSEADSIPKFGQGMEKMVERMSQPVESESFYEFSLSVVFESTTGNDKAELIQSFSEQALLIENSTDQSIIFDHKNRAILNIDSQNQTKTVIPADLLNDFQGFGLGDNRALQKNDAPNRRFEKTGKSKKILNRTAHEWRFEDGQDSGSVWFADLNGFDYLEASKKMLKTFGPKNQNVLGTSFSKQTKNMPSGFPLESTIYQNGKVTSRMNVISIDTTNKKIDLGAYQTQGMMPSS